MTALDPEDSAELLDLERARRHGIIQPEDMQDEREQAMAAMTMLVFVAKCILIVVSLIGLGLAVMWGGV